MAEGLVKILLETKQTVPDFLQGSMPEGGEDAQLDFDDDSDKEGEDEGEAEATEATNGAAQTTNDNDQVTDNTVAQMPEDSWGQSNDTWGETSNKAPAIPAW